MNRFIPALQHYLSQPRLTQLGLDLGASALAYALAYVLRFEGRPPEFYAAQGLQLFLLMLGLRFVGRLGWGVYRQLWRYFSLREVIDLAASLSTGTALFWLISQFLLGHQVPLGVLALDWGFNLLGYCALRGLRRISVERQGAPPAALPERRLLLVGAGQAGLALAKELGRTQPRSRIIGFVDDDPHKRHSNLFGLPILGSVEELPSLVAQQHIDEVILCLPSASSEQMRRIVTHCQRTSAKIKTMPRFQDLLSSELAIRRIRDVDIDDLLGRSPVHLNQATLAGYISGRRVLVTGAGGSIGSELCRQIAQVGPQQLLLLGRGEYSVYQIDQELREHFPDLSIEPLLVDVRDVHRLEQVFARYRPEVVFHAAAHKHVPLMEKNPEEAILNNVLGTRHVAECADRFECETFVLISTDKAVNPTNVMGASKRVAELVVQELAHRSRTRFMSVRFGNVLGSRGSVVPLFKRQIQAGGPLTLTHPEVTRYFMTIPEAAQLVLQAGALGTGGEVFVLDMGSPVKIKDLAHDLIQLSGLTPGTDIEIVYTGLRPGEKLYEELLTAEEGTARTHHEKIFITRSTPLERERLELGIALLERAAREGDAGAIRAGLKALVQTYHLAPQALLKD